MIFEVTKLIAPMGQMDQIQLPLWYLILCPASSEEMYVWLVVDRLVQFVWQFFRCGLVSRPKYFDSPYLRIR